MSAKEVVIDILKCLGITVIGSIIIIIICFAFGTVDNVQEKQECYEIYATDNVILKKCEKYFDKEKEK